MSRDTESDVNGVNEVGAAEAEVGRYIYRRIEALMDAQPGTPEAAELAYLARLAEGVEEYGEEACGGTAVAALTAPAALSARIAELEKERDEARAELARRDRT